MVGQCLFKLIQFTPAHPIAISQTTEQILVVVVQYL
jgi:hypothetical protein